MEISDIMTADPCTVSRDAGLNEAMLLMDERSCRHLPVVEQGMLAGILSDRDILEATGWLYDPNRPGGARKVADVMTTSPVTVTAETGIAAASIEIISRGIGCLPVTNQDGKLVGILTEMDLLEAYGNAQLDGFPRSADPPAGDHMTPDAVTISPRATLRQAIEIRHDNYFRHLPVVERGRLRGMLSDRDLRRALGQGKGMNALVADVMSSQSVTLGPDEPLTQAARLMARFRISSLPIVEDRDLLGILTSTDVIDHCGSVLTVL
ncbi:MAG: CBS domain-containing protein [Planctomycetota bacterium]